MMDDLKNILSDTPPPSNDQLKEYLKTSTTESEKYEIEKSLDENDPFLNDAMDGLIITKSNIDITLYEIESKLHKKLKSKKLKSTRKIKDYNTILMAIVFLLVMAIISFLVVKLLLKKS